MTLDDLRHIWMAPRDQSLLVKTGEDEPVDLAILDVKRGMVELIDDDDLHRKSCSA